MMLNLFVVFLNLLGFLLLLPVLIILIQTFSAIFLRPKVLLEGQRKSLAVIIPAHNEECGLLSTLQYLIPQLEAGDRLVVVADNCTDQTALVARSAGVDVIERTNLEQRGKGYALDFGIQHLSYNPPDFVVVIDADCQSSPNLLDRLVKVCSYYQRPTQALDLMHASKTAGLKVKVAAFAWLFKNKVRASGFANLGLPCQLMGTGMAFMWKDISKASLANAELVEDLKLGIECAKNNQPPLFCPDVAVESFFPENESGIKSQRARWEHGHLAMILNTAPSMLKDGIKHRNFNLLALLVDMCVPPLALLSMLIFTYLMMAVITNYFLVQLTPMIIAMLVLILFASTILISWFKFARHIITFLGLIYVPLYIFLKIPLYIKFMVRKQVEWVRSNRDDA